LPYGAGLCGHFGDQLSYQSILSRWEREEERKENTKKRGRGDAAFSVQGRNALIKIPICL
jgi:hypothetical protein